MRSLEPRSSISRAAAQSAAAIEASQAALSANARSASAEMDTASRRVRLIVENTGWLPTNGSDKAVEQQAVGDVAAELTVPAGARLVEGERLRSLGQLQGRTGQRSTATWWGYTPGTPDRAVAEWVVGAAPGAAVSAEARHDRAGTARAQVVLGR